MVMDNGPKTITGRIERTNENGLKLVDFDQWHNVSKYADPARLLVFADAYLDWLLRPNS